MEITRDNYTEARALTEGYVRDKLDGFLENRISPINLSEADYEHGVDIAVTILETKFPEIGMYGGGDFVQAVVNNDLMGAIGRADAVNQKLLLFHCQLMCSFSPYHLDYSKL